MHAVGEISREEMECLLRRVDFSEETDGKMRLWERLTERMAAEDAVRDLDDDVLDSIAAAGAREPDYRGSTGAERRGARHHTHLRLQFPLPLLLRAAPPEKRGGVARKPSTN